MNNQQMKAEIAKLLAENESLKAMKAKARTLSLKVSAKGGLSVYGLGRFPVTLYKEQWERLLAIADEIVAMLTDPANTFSSKDAPVVQPGSQQSARNRAIAELMADGDGMSKDEVLAALAGTE